MNRLLTLAMVVVCTASAYAQPGTGPGGGSGNGPGTVEETKKICWIEDIYTCAEAYAANQEAILAGINSSQYMKETYIAVVSSCSGLGTCTSVRGNPVDPENVPAFWFMTCSNPGAEVEAVNDTLRFVIGREEISHPYPNGAAPRSGRTGRAPAEPPFYMHCYNIYPCSSTCKLKAGSQFPYTLSDFECARSDVPPGLWWLREQVATGELCVGNNNM